MQNKWLLIASFKRPETNTYFKGIYSFLENFNPATGYMERSANYNNQWTETQKANGPKSLQLNSLAILLPEKDSLKIMKRPLTNKGTLLAKLRLF